MKNTKKNTFEFDIMEASYSIKTIEYRANRTVEVYESGHAIYNYEGNHYYLFNSVEDSTQFINGDETIPHAFQDSIYEDGEEIDNPIWYPINGFVLEFNNPFEDILKPN